MDPYHIDRHKMVYHIDRLAQWQAGQIIPPIYLEISPTSFCNHKCIFCAVDFAKQKPQHLDTVTLIKAISQASLAGVRSVMFAGEGEPLLHPGIIDIMQQTYGLDLAMTTNGMIGTRQLWKEILPQLSWIRFSLDAGSDQVYTDVHGVALGSFQRTLQSISEAVDIKNLLDLKTTISVQYLVLKENFNDFEQAVRVCEMLGVDNLIIKSFSRHPQTLSKYTCIYKPKAIQLIYDFVQRYKLYSTKKLNVIFRYESFQKYIEPKGTPQNCLALPFWGYIDTKGDFYTCSVHLGNENFKIGNINRRAFSQILTGIKRQQSIRYGKTIDINSQCRKNCRMARINEFLTALSNPPEHKNFI